MVTSLLSSAAAFVGHGGWGFPWFIFVVPLFWIALVVLIVTLVGRRWRRARWADCAGGPGWHAGASAESTLAERFARGDIDEAEYRARLEVLQASRPGPRR